MPHRDAAPPTRRRRGRRPRLVGLLIAAAAITPSVGCQLTTSSTPTSPSPPAPTVPTPIDVPGVDRSRALGLVAAQVPAAPPIRERDASGRAAGAVPDGTTVFDGDVPGVANLDPSLLDALRRAATDAADDGIGFSVRSGWRSVGYQRQLLDEAISTYGSEKAAARWVATPDRSAHVSGDAVDLGPSAARTWLSAHGAGYGLCQVYDNEPWHFELRPEAVDTGCPATYADASHDPRLQPDTKES